MALDIKPLPAKTIIAVSFILKQAEGVGLWHEVCLVEIESSYRGPFDRKW
jgi:hypothetical protein